MKYYYIVNSKRYYNIYLAQHEKYLHGGTIEFYCDTDEYDKLNWSKEPEESLETLMDRHAWHLRNKYEKLIFFWSGGTDSQTILNVFTRNRIHIDEIVCIGHETLSYMPLTNYHWLLANYWDKTTTITFFDKLDLSQREQVIRNEYWTVEDDGDIRFFTNGGADGYSQAWCQSRYGSHTWTMITGHEKPYLVYNNGTWWSRQEDKTLRQVMKHTVECFFLAPLLNLKQSHLVKNAMLKLKIKPYNGMQVSGMQYEKVLPDNNAGYTVFSRICGRHAEINSGVSHDQKGAHKKFSCITFDDKMDVSLGENILQERLKDKDSFALKYVNGFKTIQSDKGFSRYLNESVLMAPDQLLRTMPVYSKAYNLGL
jgi:hypothetical protein